MKHTNKSTKDPVNVNCQKYLFLYKTSKNKKKDFKLNFCKNFVFFWLTKNYIGKIKDNISILSTDFIDLIEN